MTKTQYTPIGTVHTLMHMVVREVEFVETPQGPRVRVMSTIGESESNDETVQFHLSLQEALEANIIERVR